MDEICASVGGIKRKRKCVCVFVEEIKKVEEKKKTAK